MGLFGNIQRDEEPDLTAEERAQAEQAVQDAQQMAQDTEEELGR